MLRGKNKKAYLGFDMGVKIFIARREKRSITEYPNWLVKREGVFLRKKVL